MVTLLTVAWFLFTHHCALGLMRPTGHAGDRFAECCGGKKSPRHEAPEGPRSCCKIKVTTPLAQAEGKFDASKFEVQDFALTKVLGVRLTETRRAVLGFDHGPPRCITFAELVLQRSLLSHAPPFPV